MDWRLEAGGGWCSVVMMVPSLKKIPGNWEAARPVEICRICLRFIVVYV